tara:strand:+ start:2952 stop:3671 length:720 start_codon:yes stop_codon:yes gene_type:complete
MSKDVTVILPIYNIRKRGLKRVMNSVYSLQKQDCNIIVVDGSEIDQFLELHTLLKGLNVEHVHFPIDEFNKPMLLNEGIRLSNTDYIFCSDADYIFKSDLIDTCKQYRGKNVLLHKKVKMLHSTNITTSRIKGWRFPKCNYNAWGTLANGAMQYSTKEFFNDNPYNEEMSGFGAMDNLTAYMAHKNWVAIVWVEESEILHQHHPVEKKMSGENLIKFKRNQKILADYIRLHNLPTILSK